MILKDYIYLFILLAGAVLGLVNFNKCSAAFRALTIFLLLTFLKETLNATIPIYSNGNALLQNLYTPLHAGFFVCIFYLLLKNSAYKKTILYTGIVVFLVILIGIITSAMSRLSWIFISLDALMLVFFSILYFFNLMQHPVEQNIIASGNMWLSTSVLVYFTASFIFWISYNLIAMQSQDVQSLLFYILDQLGSIHYFLLLIALYFHVREKRKNAITAGKK